MRKILPLLEWLPRYQKGSLRFDIIAGLSVWALLVPESVAYSSIAGVPAQYGLYAALFALLGYAVFGTSKQMVTGPSATVAAVSASVVSLVAVSGSSEWLTLTATLAVIAGLVYIVLGVLRMGWVSYFLSSAVIAGFVFGFGIGLIIDQSHKILGVDKVEGSYFRILVGTVGEISETSLPTLAVGGLAVVLMLAMRRFLPKWPRALIVVGMGIVVSAALDLVSDGVKIAGVMPTGLPSFTVPDLSTSTLGTMLLGAGAVIMVGFSESLAAARDTAVKHDYEIDASQEMIAQGAANGFAGLFGGFAVSGSLSKTAVADLSGQKSQVASLAGSGLILLTILVLIGLFTNLPEAVLGAVVIDAAIGLVKVREFRRVMATSRKDFAAYLAAMAGLLFVGVLAGVIIGVVLSLLLLIASAARSPVRPMVYSPRDDAFVDAARYPQAETLPGILVTEIDGPLFFADSAGFKDRLAAEAEKDSLKGIVIDMGPVTFIDMDGADIITKVKQQMSSKGIRIVLARVGEEEYGLLDRAGCLDEIGAENVFTTVREAVAALSPEA